MFKIRLIGSTPSVAYMRHLEALGIMQILIGVRNAIGFVCSSSADMSVSMTQTSHRAWPEACDTRQTLVFCVPIETNASVIRGTNQPRRNGKERFLQAKEETERAHPSSDKLPCNFPSETPERLSNSGSRSCATFDPETSTLLN